MLVAPIMDASDSSSVILRIVPVMFLVGLLIILPFLAKREEEDYRRGHNTYKAIILKSIPFGLVHLLAGIPLAAGFALIGVGIFYGHKYKTALDKLTPSMPYELAENEAVMVATVYHTLYNSVLVILLIIIASIAL